MWSSTTDRCTPSSWRRWALRHGATLVADPGECRPRGSTQRWAAPGPDAVRRVHRLRRDSRCRDAQPPGSALHRRQGRPGRTTRAVAGLGAGAVARAGRRSLVLSGSQRPGLLGSARGRRDLVCPEPAWSGGWTGSVPGSQTSFGLARTSTWSGDSSMTGQRRPLRPHRDCPPRRAPHDPWVAGTQSRLRYRQRRARRPPRRPHGGRRAFARRCPRGCGFSSPVAGGRYPWLPLPCCAHDGALVTELPEDPERGPCTSVAARPRRTAPQVRPCTHGRRALRSP